MSAPTTVTARVHYPNQPNVVGVDNIQFRGEYKGQKLAYLTQADGKQRHAPAVDMVFTVGGVEYRCLAVDLVAAITAASFRARNDYDNATADPVSA